MAWRMTSVRSATVVVVVFTTGAGANAGGRGKAAAEDARVWSSPPRQLLWGAMIDETSHESPRQLLVEGRTGERTEHAAKDKELQVTLG